jgi:hypothetical protein
MVLTTDVHLVVRLRMSGDLPVLLLFGFMAQTGTTLLLLFFIMHFIIVTDILQTIVDTARNQSM